MQKLTHKFSEYKWDKDLQLHDQQKGVLHDMEDRIHSIQAPLNRLEHDFHLPVSLLVIPLFALANAGIAMDFSKVGDLVMEPVTLGVMFGLVVGKVVGIAGVALIAIKLGLAKLPAGASGSQIFGVSLLGGIGFTMSIFIANLAWLGNEALLLQAKVGILFASIFAGVAGFVWLRFVAKSDEHHAQA